VTSPTLYGIRHHGPGSARSLRDALIELSPDVVLIEGPPEADGLVELAGDPEMQPPVALLAYVPGEPGSAAFWPFAEFSPEWQAMKYALDAGVPVRFCDLPAAHQLALRDGPERERSTSCARFPGSSAGRRRVSCCRVGMEWGRLCDPSQTRGCCARCSRRGPSSGRP
jgi:hypothetical protein